MFFFLINIQLSRNYESKQLIIQERDSSIKCLENKLEDLQIASNQMKIDLLDQLKNEQNGKIDLIT